MHLRVFSNKIISNTDIAVNKNVLSGSFKKEVYTETQQEKWYSKHQNQGEGDVKGPKGARSHGALPWVNTALHIVTYHVNKFLIYFQLT